MSFWAINKCIIGGFFYGKKIKHENVSVITDIFNFAKDNLCYSLMHEDTAVNTHTDRMKNLNELFLPQRANSLHNLQQAALINSSGSMCLHSVSHIAISDVSRSYAGYKLCKKVELGEVV